MEVVQLSGASLPVTANPHGRGYLSSAVAAFVALPRHSLLLLLQLPLSGTVCAGQGMEEGCFLEGAEAIYPLPGKETREVKGWRLIVYLRYKIEDA